METLDEYVWLEKHTNTQKHSSGLNVAANYHSSLGTKHLRTDDGTLWKQTGRVKKGQISSDNTGQCGRGSFRGMCLTHTATSPSVRMIIQTLPKLVSSHISCHYPSKN